MIALDTAPPPAGELALLPTRRVVWGSGSLARLPDLLDEFGASRTLVLTSRSLANEANLVAGVVRQCGPRYAGRFERLPAHVPLDAVDAATATAARRRSVVAAAAPCRAITASDGRPPLLNFGHGVDQQPGCP